MIERVFIFNQNTVSVIYTSGKRASYSLVKIPGAVLDFVLGEKVKAYENGFSVMYCKEA